MYFCKGEEDFADTQCCFFIEVSGADEQFPNISREELSGLSKLKCAKNHEENYQKENKLVNKNTRLQKSQQKSKFSLSKLSGKKANCSQQNTSQKEITLNQSNSQNTSTLKSKRTDQPSINILVPPIQPMTHPSLHYQSVNRQSLNQYFCSNNAYQTSTSKNKITQEFPVIFSSQLPVQYIRVNEVHKAQRAEKEQSQRYFPTSVNPDILKSMIYRVSKPQYHQYTQSQLCEQDLNRRSSRPQQQVHHINIIGLEQTKGVPSTATSIPTDRIIVQSQTQTALQNIQSPCQKLGIFQSLYKFPENKIIESRLTETLSPDFGIQHFRAVNSVYCSEIGGKKQVEESVILIDFFNPNEKLKKQLEGKLKSTNVQQFFP